MEPSKSTQACLGPRLADTSAMHFGNLRHLLFAFKFAWQRKTQCLQTPIPRAPIAPAITRGSAFFDAFLGFWSREKTTIAHHSDAKIQWNRWLKGNPDAQELADVTCRLWKGGFKTRAFVARGITGRSIWFSSFRPGYVVRDFSITPSLTF